LSGARDRYGIEVTAMRKLGFILAIALLAAGTAWAQSEDSIAEYARKVRAERAKKEGAKVKMYTNDNLPAATTISTVGTSSAAEGGTAAEGAAAAGAAAEGEAPPAEGEKKECDEACWKGKFSDQRAKIKEAETQVDILQREYNLARVQYYQDPNAAMREQYSNVTGGGRELQDLLKRIDEKKAEVEKLKQDLSRLEDDLRRSGGQPGWARP
jgi:predicted RNase H-like nuclease (RuvC/YqgF family)